jgi:hypothetical protein
MTGGLRRVQQHKTTILLSRGGEPRHILQTPGDVRGVIDHCQTHGESLQNPLKFVLIQQSGHGVKRDQVTLNSAMGCQKFQGAQYGIVIQCGGQYVIARLQKPQQNRIKTFGAVAGEDNMAGGWSVQQTGRGRATLLQDSGGR